MNLHPSDKEELIFGQHAKFVSKLLDETADIIGGLEAKKSEQLMKTDLAFSGTDKSCLPIIEPEIQQLLLPFSLKPVPSAPQPIDDGSLDSISSQ